MSSAGELKVEGNRLVLSGNWTLPHYADLRSRISAVHIDTSSVFDKTNLEEIDQLDTAGASLLVELFGVRGIKQLISTDAAMSRERRDMINIVIQSLDNDATPESQAGFDVRVSLARMGRRIVHAVNQLMLLIGFGGQLIEICLAIFWQPRRWRVTSFVAHLHQTGLNALPIVALLSFLVGAVVAFLGATVLEDFGATIYTVNLVAFSFLREFGVMLAAILVAGRTASAYTAQIGSMKANEEVDAIRTLGLSPMELLVVPRVMAMVVALPILALTGMVSGIVGGSLVCIVSLDIALPQILHILQERIGVIHFYVGISKAPVFAFVIAMIGCLEGFKTRGSAQSVGEHTTSAVVQSIFMVILLDSIAAIFFMEMGW
ncbi:ABC transporter permease [Marinobacter sp. CHS3-4]|uniref:MlaE family ABC transporter permease n=1 Tax=Marinobacter sp. CHS3-4 TaxID=3045174 RepID=UPI0024B4E473|nr:ABC transporter permease [Marinobacter sp. CHS3-4]MDI9245287.1 ABC transporter permease [Marinobacter sp. CHS3-4]